MRNRTKTIEALRRLAERPGTPEEGEAARLMLKRFGGKLWVPRLFDASMFPPGTQVFYCYWCYRNDPGVVCKQAPKMQRGQWWMRIKFDRLKQPRWVPVTSELGCHLGLEPFEGNDQETLYRRDVDWEQWDRDFEEQLRKAGIVLHRESAGALQPQAGSLTMGKR
jgi:hypothetical protein